jgi:ABC-type Fe3+/spermidine/putrescine transport system ATPase subunit
MTRVTLTGLTKVYPGAATPALERLTLDLPSGGLTAFLGPSGCGKTTALRLIAGLLQPTAGDVLFDGRSVLPDPPERRSAVMVFQNHLLFPGMTVAGNVGFGLRMRGMPRRDIAARVTAMLDRVQLAGLGTRRPQDLSGGQQQRVALARALIVEPRVLLLDEPLSSLDPHLRDGMRDLIRQVQRDLGITTIVVTHDQAEAVVLADRIALILNGRMRQHDRPEAFFRRPADAGVARFFGAANLLPGAVTGDRFAGVLGPLTVTAGDANGPGLLTFRPESVQIGPGPVNNLTALVTDRTYLGTQTRLTLRVSDTDITVLLSPMQAEPIVPGQTLTIHLPPDQLWVMPPET